VYYHHYFLVTGDRIFGTLKRTLRNTVGYFPEIHVFLLQFTFPSETNIQYVFVEMLFFVLKSS
jgi:hypothetical protein